MAEYTKNIEKWHQLKDGLRYNWLVDYAAFSAFGTFELSNEDWEKRDFIVNFKGNSELTTEMDHQNAVVKAIDNVTQLVLDTFGEEAQTLTFICVPASTEANTERRFLRFSQEVCKLTGMTNAYGKLDDKDFWKDKDIVIFDDIIASGGSICRFAEKMKTLGAHVICAIALGKKISDGYDQEHI